jgi:hypothetical protein
MMENIPTCSSNFCFINSRTQNYDSTSIQNSRCLSLLAGKILEKKGSPGVTEEPRRYSVKGMTTTRIPEAPKYIRMIDRKSTLTHYSSLSL